MSFNIVWPGSPVKPWWLCVNCGHRIDAHGSLYCTACGKGSVCGHVSSIKKRRRTFTAHAIPVKR